MKPNKIAELRKLAGVNVTYQSTDIWKINLLGNELNECLDEIERLQKLSKAFIAIFENDENWEK